MTNALLIYNQLRFDVFPYAGEIILLVGLVFLLLMLELQLYYFLVIRLWQLQEAFESFTFFYPELQEKRVYLL